MKSAMTCLQQSVVIMGGFEISQQDQLLDGSEPKVITLPLSALGVQQNLPESCVSAILRRHCWGQHQQEECYQEYRWIQASASLQTLLLCLSQNLGDWWLGYHCVVRQEAYTFGHEQCEKGACVTSVEYGLALSADLTWCARSSLPRRVPLASFR